MSALGNIAAAQSAKKIGRYNESVAYQEAQYLRKKAAVQEKVYNKIERPRFLKAQEMAMANFRVSAFRSGAEYRDGTTPFLVGVENLQNQLLDLSLADYNQEVKQNDIINQSILIAARGQGERFKGELTARTEYMKAAGSLLTMGSKSQQAGTLVIA